MSRARFVCIHTTLRGVIQSAPSDKMEARMSRVWTGIACLAISIAALTPSRAEDRLLGEVLNFTGAITSLSIKAPAFILVGVRDGEIAVAGFGNGGDRGGGKPPDADTMFRIGSISKVFCGEVLAS